MTTDFDAFADPAPHDGIYRDKLDRPMVFAPDHAEALDFTQGKTIKGRRGYARVTSFIDVLDSKDALDVYHQRLVLIGLAKEPSLLVEAHESLQLGTPDDKIVKDALNHVASKARAAADEDLKAAKGTAIHRWCEEADLGKPLSATQVSDGYTFKLEMFAKDVEAYIAATRHLLHHEHIEQLCVNDELQTAGTPDRISEWIGPPTLVPAFGGSYIRPGDVLIVDLKTGNVEYGIGKFAMQLGVYANSVLYDQATNTRTDMHDALHQIWGLIVHVPAGTGQADLIWVDINKGYDAASNLAPLVRAWRNDGKKLAAKHDKQATLSDMIAATFNADQVRDLWVRHQDQWSDEVTELARARVAQFEGKEAA